MGLGGVPAAGCRDNPSRPAPDSSFPALPPSSAPFPTHFDSAKQLRGQIPEGARALSRWPHPAWGLWWPAQVPGVEGILPRDALISGRCAGFRGNPYPHPSACVVRASPEHPWEGICFAQVHLGAGGSRSHPSLPLKEHTHAPPPRQQWQRSPWPNASQLLAEGNIP